MSEPADRRAHCEAAVRELLSALGEPVRTDRHPFAYSLLEASYDTLQAGGYPKHGAMALSLIPELTRYTQRERFGKKPSLANVAAAGAFLLTRYYGIQIEQFHLLSLNSSGRLLDCTLIQEGTLDETPFYLREILRGIARSGADTVVLCHNHPGGTPRPSRADIECTLAALRALKPLGIPLLDHIIIAADRAISIREDGYIDNTLWLSQAPNSKLMRHWLDRK